LLVDVFGRISEEFRGERSPIPQLGGKHAKRFGRMGRLEQRLQGVALARLDPLGQRHFLLVRENTPSPVPQGGRTWHLGRRRGVVRRSRAPEPVKLKRFTTDFLPLRCERRGS
jgi:hypothetical protein